MPISIAVIQRTALATQLLCRALDQQPEDFAVIPCGHTFADFLAQVSTKRPEMAVVDEVLPGHPTGGIKMVRELRVATPDTRAIVLLECSESQQVIDAFSAGARGVVCQADPFEVLCKCIRRVHTGQIWASSQELQWIVKALGEREPVRVVSVKGVPLLTKREDEVVRMVVEGLPNVEIGQKLGVSAHTVKNHLFRIYEKLGISSRVELILYAMTNKQGA